jgi:hypothetical protein
MTVGNTWIGAPSPSSEPSTFGGRRHYYQVAFCHNGKRGTKKFAYEPHIDGSAATAKSAAESFVSKKKKELGIL